MLPCVLTINGGSSSIRFAFYEEGDTPLPQLDGKIDRIGLGGTTFTVTDSSGAPQLQRGLASADHRTAVGVLLDYLEAHPLFSSIKAVGHRIVHGTKHFRPARVTVKLLDELHRITAYAPEHLPLEIELIEAFSRRHPALLQIVCFDTAFHRSMPRVARLLPIPRRYSAKGVERYGFHGMSYAYLMEELGRLDPVASKGRVVLAHLGNGASLAAVRDGESVDTSMGFTPASGMMMSTRAGDIDPGLPYYLAHSEHMTGAQIHKMVNHESGLLGISGTSSDMRDLLEQESSNVRAAEAVALFCYQAKKWIGSYAAVLGGIDTLVFAGGIGENAPLVRARICEGLNFLGIELKKSRNVKSAGVISTDAGRVTVRVIRTDEEQMIARSVYRALHPVKRAVKSERDQSES
jgi:acetate kinase